MSEVAIGTRRLAIAEILGFQPALMHATGRGMSARNRESGTSSLSATAYRLAPIASLDAANSFTVTGQVTSVTHPGLAESVLIDVSEFALGRGPRSFEPTACRRCRSFQGGACIQ